MNLGKKLVKIRKDNKMSQEDFAEIFNVTRQTISSWENSKSYPDIETLVKISNKFNISLDILLKEEERMIKEIDTKVKNNHKLKIIIILLVLIIITSSSIILINNYKKLEKEREQEERYNEVISNLNILGFNKKDGIGFSKLVEDEVTYSVYVKKSDTLENRITATTKWTDEEAIYIDYNGEKVTASYINENNKTIYLDDKGNLLNDKQNKNNTEIYNKYKDKTVSMVIRMTELYKEIYN